MKKMLRSRSTLVLAAALALGTASAFAEAEEPFLAVHHERERAIELDASPDEAFRMFEPKGRELWSSHWKPEYLYPHSGEARKGTVARYKVHGHEWAVAVVADYEPEARMIRYLIFLPNSEAWEMEIRCLPTPSGKTIANVTYRVTALTPEMNEPVESFFENDFDEAIDAWQPKINAALANGPSR